jgi:hypothetical protein
MNKRLLFLISCVICVAAWAGYERLIRPTAFERTFDVNLQGYPFAASMAAQDPALREMLLYRTEAAFDKGGWIAANKALDIALGSEVEIYADDEHINAITRAEAALLRDLESKPLACRAFLYAGGMADELLQAKPNDTILRFAHRAALRNGFDRRMSGVRWTRPDYNEFVDAWRDLAQGPVTPLTVAELKARANYVDGDPQLVCGAAIKEYSNLMALGDADAARVKRILMADTARTDAAEVIAKVCVDNIGWSCP